MRGRYVLPFSLFIFFHKNEINYKLSKPLVKPTTSPCQFIYILTASRLAPAEAGGLQVASRPASFAAHAHRKHLTTSSNTTASKQSLHSPQNDLGGCRDQVYHFYHQKLPLYAQSRSHSIQGMAGHSGQTRKQTNSSLFY